MRASRRVRARIRSGVAPSRRTGGALEAVGRRAAAVAARTSIPVTCSGEALGSKVVAAFGGMVFGALSVAPARAVAGALAGAWVGTKMAARIGARVDGARETATTAELPHVLERLGTALRTGCSIDAALRTVAPGARGPLGDALRDAVRAGDLGGSRSEMLARVGAAPGEPARRAVATLIRSHRLGSAAADVVDALAADVRARARAAAEADARTAPIRMLFPLVFCFLPAFVLLTIAPIAVEALRTLGGI